MNESPFLFVSYSESDYEQIDNILLELYKRRIPVKTEKDATHCELEYLIGESSAVMLVISPDSLNSSNIRHHIQLAEEYNRHIIPYFLYSPDELEVPDSLYLKIDGSATIPAYEYAEEAALVNRAITELKPYFSEVFEAPKKKKAPIATILFTIIGCFALVLAYFTWIKPAQQTKILNNVRNATTKIYSTDENYIVNSTGSGFFINADGLIATNYHVIDNADKILIQKFGDDKFYPAALIAADIDNDLALLQAHGTLNRTFSVTSYLSLSNLIINVGDSIFVSGYPKGIDLTISNGIVSNNKHFTASDGTEYYLITAAVSHGNSGGPVVSSDGKVIGIATAKYTEAENLNLARPVSYLKELIKKNNLQKE